MTLWIEVGPCAGRATRSRSAVEIDDRGSVFVPDFFVEQRVAVADLQPAHRRSGTRVDDTEAISLGIGHHDEIRIRRIQVPIDDRCAEGDEALHLRRLILGIARVEVEMHTRMLLRSRSTDVECKVRAGGAGSRDEDHEVVVGGDLAFGYVVQRLGPEGDRSMEVANTHHNGSDAQHAPFLTTDHGLGRRHW